MTREVMSRKRCEKAELLEWLDKNPRRVTYLIGYGSSHGGWAWMDSEQNASDAMDLLSALRAARGGK
jgi:hypothetical protein